MHILLLLRNDGIKYNIEMLRGTVLSTVGLFLRTGTSLFRSTRFISTLKSDYVAASRTDHHFSFVADNWNNILRGKAISNKSCESRYYVGVSVLEKKEVFPATELDESVGVAYDCGSVLKKRRSKMNKHKYKKLRKRTKFLRRRLGK